jgi:hypothetical protein
MAELIRVEKDGEVMEVHPAALKQHLLLHWREAPAPIIIEPVKRGPGRPKRTEPLT